jgi:hypothetical protein
MSFEQPVLLITFNRPDTTEKVLAAIAKEKPKRLYVFSDAPRIGNKNDEKKVKETRELFKHLTWEVELRTKFMNENLGCARGVTSAINWIFETEEQAIILEDDCLPSTSFFQYCEQMLHRYKSVDNVMHIAGTRWNPEFQDENSYLYSSIAHIWGWATWKRAWMKYDFEMNNWKDQVSKIKKSIHDPIAIQYWKELFEAISKSKHKHTWDYQWQYTLFKENGIAIIPNVNLISNIGLQGVHAKVDQELTESQKYVFKKEIGQWRYLESPKTVVQNEAYDRYHMRNHFLKFSTWLSRRKKAVKYYMYA